MVVLLASEASSAATAWHAGALAALLIVAAVVGGIIARNLPIRVPSVVGFLLAGVVCRGALQLLGFGETAEAASTVLGPLRDLALGLILFAIGGVFDVARLRAAGGRLFRISLFETGLTVVVVTACVTLAAFLTLRGEPAERAISFGLLLGCAGIATAPAATLFVLREYEAKGPVTDMLLGLTGLNNVICIVSFNVCFLVLASLGWLGSTTADQGGTSAWLVLLASIAGSAALGLLTGVALSLVHVRLAGPNAVLVILAAMLGLSSLEVWLVSAGWPSFSFLLTCLCAGAVFTNVATDPEKLSAHMEPISGPLMVGFFVIAGFGLHLQELADIGWVGAAYISARFVAKLFGVVMGVRATGGPTGGLRQYIGLGLMCQAAVIVGLAEFVQDNWTEGDFAHSFEATVLGAVVVFELIGPWLTKDVVVRCGEVKAVTLVGWTGSDEEEEQPSTSLVFGSIQRLIGLAGSGPVSNGGELSVRHVMRTNIKTIPSVSTFDDVLRLVEQSHYNHFPVVDDDDHLVGVMHFDDIQEVVYNPHLADLVTAADLASTDTRSVAADLSLEMLADRMKEWRVSSLPVVDGSTRRVVGVVEQRDALRALHGAGKGSGKAKA